jgi:hypothetical protein
MAYAPCQVCGITDENPAYLWSVPSYMTGVDGVVQLELSTTGISRDAVMMVVVMLMVAVFGLVLLWILY